MPLTVVPALIPDIPRIYEIYFAAFDQDDMGKKIVDILFPFGTTSDEFKKHHNKATLDWWHHSDDQYTFKAIDSETGDILGMALADLVVKPKPAEERINHGVPWLEGEHRVKAETILNPLWEAKNDLVGSIPHLYVHVIAVEPKHQGRKAGALLCQYGLEMSEKLQLPLYIESSPTTHGLYRMFGFQELDRKVVHKGELFGQDEDISVPLMIRMPESYKGIKFEDWAAQGYPKPQDLKPVPQTEATKEEAPKEEAPKTETPAPQAETPKAKTKTEPDVHTLTQNLTQAVGGEQNLTQLAELVSTIVLSKLPELVASSFGIQLPAPAAPETKKPAEVEVETVVKPIDTKAVEVNTTEVQVTPTDEATPATAVVAPTTVEIVQQ